jgi:glycosyltransferase involved in cell wall biosynthesis
MLCHDHEIKGSRDGVRAIEITRDRFPDLEATFFGVDPRPDFVPGWIRYVQNPPQSQLVEEIYNQSQVFLTTSYTESFCLTSIEAMACGNALVTTDCGGSRDYAFHGETALVCQPEDADTMAEHLISLLGDDELRLRIAERGQEYVQRYDWDRSAATLDAFLRRYREDPERYQKPEDEFREDDYLAFRARAVRPGSVLDLEHDR